VLVAISAGPSGDGALATITINRVVDLLDSFNELNEFKQTRIARWKVNPWRRKSG